MRGEYEERSSIHALLPATICTGVSVHCNPVLSSRHPRVEQCAPIQQSTPTKYFCRD